MVIHGLFESTAAVDEPCHAPEAAVTVAAPTPAARTSPAGSTVATLGWLDDQSNSTPGTTLSRASRAVASRRTVSPTSRITVSGATRTAATACSTEIPALPDADPARAVIVAVPLLAAVTSPDPSTDATDGALLAQATAAPDMVRPF